MSKKFAVGILVGVFLITAFAFAENGGQLQPTATVAAAVGQPATAAALPEEAKPAAKPAPAKPALGITYGWDGRLRMEAFNNFADFSNNLNDEVRSMRWRNRLFVNVPLGESVDAFIRVGQESWKRWSATPAGATGPLSRSISVPWSAGNIWIDNAFLDFKRMPLKNLTLRVGRQDINRGDTLVSLWSGEGGLGPKAGGFDAFDLGYTYKKHKFEMMGIWDPAQDDFYPVINQKYPAIPTVTPSATDKLNELGNVQAIGLYYTGRSMKTTDIDAFYFLIKEYDQANIINGGPGSYMFIPDRHFSWIGGHVVHRFPYDFIGHANFAGEVGTQDKMTSAANFGGTGSLVYPQTDIRSWGSFNFATKYFPKVKTKPFVRFVNLMYSGQDPKSKTYGAYDPIFGRYTGQPTPFQEGGYRYPLFSDEYPNSTRGEYGQNPAYYTNLKLLGVEGGFTPLQGKVRVLQIRVAYQHAGAFNPYAPDPVHAGATVPAYFSTTGTTRYNMVKAAAEFVLYKQLSGFMSVEKDYWGDFYNKQYTYAAVTPNVIAYRNDGIAFRAELNYRFTGFLPYHKLAKF